MTATETTAPPTGEVRDPFVCPGCPLRRGGVACPDSGPVADACDVFAASG